MIKMIATIYIIKTIYIIMQTGTRVQQRHCLIKQLRKSFKS
jgi:hypothetical protein